MIFITISSGSTLFSAIPGPESHPNSPALHLPFGNVVWVAKAAKWTPRNVFHIPASLCCIPTSHCVSAVRQGKAIHFRISQYLQNAPATPGSLGTWWRRKPEATEIWYWQKAFFFFNSSFFALGTNRWKGLWLQVGTNCGLWICFQWWNCSWMWKLLQTLPQYCCINNYSFHLHKAWKNLFSAKVTMWYEKIFMCLHYHRFSPWASLWKDTEEMDSWFASKEQGKSD